MSERSEIWHGETWMNIFQGGMPRLCETITVWSEEGAMLMGHPVYSPLKKSISYIKNNISSNFNSTQSI